MEQISMKEITEVAGELRQTKFTQCSFKGVRFDNVSFCEFHQCEFQKCTFSSSLKAVRFTQCIGIDSDFSKAKLRFTWFHQVRMNLNGAQMHTDCVVDLSVVSLRGVEVCFLVKNSELKNLESSSGLFYK